MIFLVGFVADFWVAGVAGRQFWRVVLERFFVVVVGKISVGGVGEIFVDVVGRDFGGWCWKHGGREDLPTFR